MDTAVGKSQMGLAASLKKSLDGLPALSDEDVLAIADDDPSIARFVKWDRFFTDVSSRLLEREMEIMGIQLALLSRNHVGLIGPTGTGKCLGRGTPVLMFDGTVRAVEDIRKGDLLMGPDSKPRTVLNTTHGVGQLFKVTPTKGETYICNEHHALSLRMSHQKGELINIPIWDYLGRSKDFRRLAKGWRTGVEFPARKIPIPPYLLGVWLGDGAAHRASVTTADPEIRDYLEQQAGEFDVRFVHVCDRGKASTYALSGPHGGRKGGNRLFESLRRLNLLRNKHIPQDYLLNSRKRRLELLAGLLDTDGCLSCGGYEIGQKRIGLAKQIVFLARSLGFAATFRRKRCICTNSQNPKSRIYGYVFISGNTAEIPVRVARKKAGIRKQVKNVLHTGIAVEAIGCGAYYGFSLDADHLFLLGDFTVTHNSYLASSVLGRIKGASLFKLQCKRGMTEESFFGHPDYKALREKGILEYRMEGMLPEAEFAFLDEFSDLSDVSMRIPLQVLFERECSLGSTTLKCALHTAIVTANYTRENEVTSALWDRIVLRFQCTPLGTKEAKAKLLALVLGNGKKAKSCCLDYADVEALADILPQVRLGKYEMSLLVDLVDAFETVSKRTVSDRRLGEIGKIVQAEALRCRRMTVVPLDLAAARYGLILVGNSEQETWFATAFKQVVEPFLSTKSQSKKDDIEGKIEAILKLLETTSGPVTECAEWAGLVDKLIPYVKSARDLYAGDSYNGFFLRLNKILNGLNSR